MMNLTDRLDVLQVLVGDLMASTDPQKQLLGNDLNETLESDISHEEMAKEIKRKFQGFESALGLLRAEVKAL